MSTTVTTPPTDTPPPPSQARSLPEWVREPLLHFIILGGLLFAADHMLIVRSDDPRTIVVGAAVDNEAKQLFKSSSGRDPDAKELAALRQVWLDNEVLYREGLALQVDKGDSAIRDRVIFKALSVVDANVKLPPADDKLLRAWFESHRDKYDEPARYDFQEAVPGGDTSEAALNTFVTTLNRGTPGDAKAGLRVFKGRPYGNLVQSYGAEFPKLLQESPRGRWRVLQTKDGLRVMLLDAVTPAKPAQFEVLRGVVLQDWTDATASEQRTAAVRALARKYKVKFEAAAK